MAKEALTAKQQEIFDYLCSMILKNGYPPSVREICDAVSLNSPATVHAHLLSLESKGYIRRDPAHARTIEILDDSFQMLRKETVSIPIVGQVAAGQPILAEENIEDYFSVPADYMPSTSNDVFVLQVRGESMINVGIYDKDLLIVEQTKTARNGEIVVALIDDSATVKTYYKENGHYRLQPENDTMDPIIVDHVEILGKVRALFRPSIL